MDNQLFNMEAGSIWKRASSNSRPEELQFEFDVYKRLLQFFQVGEYFYLVFNPGNFRFDAVSQNIQVIMGYAPAEFTLELLMESVHPEDRPWFLNFENKTAEFLATLPVEKLLKYKIRYDFRLRKKDGGYIRLLHQSITIEHDENGRILRVLCLETDISHLKQDGKPVLSFIGLDGEPSYINVDVEKVFTVSKEFLSKREKQILLMIMEGKLSKEISQILHISKQTVDTHRNNMIEKNGLRNTSELIAKAIRHGWI